MFTRHPNTKIGKYRKSSVEAQIFQLVQGVVTICNASKKWDSS
jgi:hypothetical protein